MSHKRVEIREAVRAAIVAGATDAGANVFSQRATPLWDIPMPAILIYAREESSEPLNVTQRKLKRTLQLAIEVRTEANDALDDVLDAISNQVEAIVDSDDTFGGVVSQSTLVSTELDVSPEGEMPIGGSRLTYEVVYVS